MAIQKEIWVNYIIENLFKGNPHLQNAFNEDEFVLAGKVVHIPQAGAKPTVRKNRSTLPATAVKRGDTDIVYVLDEYTSDPTLIPNADTVELSYDKMNSVLSEHILSLREEIGSEIIVKWLEATAAYGSVTANGSAATVIRTTGDSAAAYLGGATGNRKIFVKEDLKKARTMMNKQNILKEDRFALFSSDALDQLMDDKDLKARDNALELDMRSGSIGRLYGFEILERSETGIYTNTGTPTVKAYGAAAAAADNDAVVCYQKNAVSRAMGNVDFFEDMRNPLYYGDIYSALCRMGGRKRRKNAEGIVAIVQAHA